MINEKSITAVENSQFSTEFCKPLYSSYCFSQIPKTVFSLFTDRSDGLPSDTYLKGPYKQVVLLLIDGFGWHFFEKYRDRCPILARICNEGIASKITSMFPSTTAGHITCIHTDLVPSQSGIYEWFIYEPSLDEIIAPLPYQIAGDRAPDSLQLDPTKIFPNKTIYQSLSERGIKSIAVQPANICDSVYSKAICHGAKILGYSKPSEGLDLIIDQLKPSTYAFFYYGGVDSIGHRKGIDSTQFSKCVEEIFIAIEAFVKKLPKETALIITADHGMTAIDPKTTFYLNEQIPNIEKYLLHNKRGRPLAPAGSPRDYFVHASNEKKDELIEILTHFLKGKAEVYPTEKLIDEGFFGSKNATQAFLGRVGNIVILPYKGEAIWWHEKKRFSQNFYGSHGGLTRQEMESIFLFLSS